MTMFKAASGVTPISNVFIEKYMPDAKAAIFSVIYIFALKYALSGDEISNSDIAERLRILESDVIKAWEYWAEQGVIKLTKNDGDYVIEFMELTDSTTLKEAAPAVELKPAKQISPVKPVYTSDDIEGILQANPDIRQLVQAAEKIYAKPFSSSDLSTVIGFSTWLGLPDEVIMVLFNHCEGKPMRYIEKTACDWADRGINSSDSAEEYINTYYSKYREIMSSFGIAGRNPVDKEITYMNNWLYSLKISMELIKLACQRAVEKTGKTSFDYANGILLDWQKNNVKTLADVEAYDLAFKQKKAAQAPKADNIPKAVQPQLKPTKFVNYNQPVYTDEEIEAAIKRKKQRAKK